MIRRSLSLLSTLAACALLDACGDPIHDNAVAALGEEENGVPRGPTHRPGQPWLTCHGGDGPAGPTFSIAGTIYEKRGERAPANGVTVRVTDANGDQRDIVSNRVGNFYVGRGAWSPVFPLQVSLLRDQTETHMETLINGAGGCASCHRGEATAGSMPPVYLRNE